MYSILIESHCCWLYSCRIKHICIPDDNFALFALFAVQIDQYYSWSNQIRLKYGHLVSQQAERSAKRLYVGNLPADITGTFRRL